jgi:hypothetical protein
MDLRTTRQKQVTNKFMKKLKKKFKTQSCNIIVWIKIRNYIEFQIIRSIRIIEHKNWNRTPNYKFIWTETEPRNPNRPTIRVIWVRFGFRVQNAHP